MEVSLSSSPWRWLPIIFWRERWLCGCWLPGNRRGFPPNGWPIRLAAPESPVFVAITAAAFALIWSVFTNDFSITYIMEHSNRALPGPYKFSALWSGQEGSLLLWAWLLATYGFVLRLTP